MAENTAATNAESGIAARSAVGNKGLLWIFLAAAGAFCLRQPSNFDVFWYLRAGNEMLSRRSLLRTDPFSYTSAQPWMNHEWLSEILIALVHRIAGFPGLALLQAVVVTGTLALVLRPRNPPTSLARLPVALGLACATVTLGLSAEPRAQLFSWVLFTVTLIVCLEDWRMPSRRLWWVVPVGVLWANLHGGNPTGLALLSALFVCGASVRRGLVFLAAAAATLASPYGWHVHEHFLGAHATLPEIREWHSLFKALALGSVPQWSALLPASLAWAHLLGRARRRETIRFDIVVLMLFSLLAVRYARFTWELAIVAAALLVRAPGRGAARSPRLLAFATILATFATATLASDRPLGFSLDARRLPVAAVDYLDHAKPPGPMLNSYNFGGYLLWARPSEPVFIDSRAFMVYSESHVRDLLRLYDAPALFHELQRRWSFRLAVLQRFGRGAAFLAWLRAQPDWHVVHEDTIATVLERR